MRLGVVAFFILAAFAAPALAPAQTQPGPCPATHYQCSPGICCPR
jgi:hypothetical protein